MPICDGCGATVDAEHIRQRIERLELATRYRPVHIQTLLIGAAPPRETAEYFYSGEQEANELQRNGLFLVYALECPLPADADENEAVRRAATTVLKRIQFSYKPKSILLFSPGTAALIAPLREAGWTDRLILKDGGPFPDLPGIDRLGEQRGTGA